MLVNFTDQGLRGVKEVPNRQDKSGETAKKFGVERRTANNLFASSCDNRRPIIAFGTCFSISTIRAARRGLLKRDRIKDFFRFPVSGLFDGSMKLWFLTRRSVRRRLRRL